MKHFLSLATLLCSTGLSHAATAYWSFQNGAGNVYVPDATYHSGFASAPTFSAFAGTGGATLGSHGAGQAYTEPTTSTSYVGGYATYWDSGGTQEKNLTGAGFTVTMDMTSLSDLSMRFDIRSAAGDPNNKVGLPTSFSSINYRLSDTGSWTDSGIAAPNWTISPNGFYEFNMNLAALDAIEGQGYVELQFIFNGGEKTMEQPQNVRLDNLQFTAVPEPSALALLAPLAGVVFLRRRKD
ncbi:PEP-CTERM sorting domain-containing protein [Luteolibacter sp. SL250]|uniref:PEP-CTERM sorting domain-containing protein n=1 Tax=Luteolibacter sp. SL250 TaxID=2995170 RepID=UPI002270E68F|nr:PEP-CTERM sorting domain-containing protein [Luteolibacter sp. SL250]WAC19613.1 PEP-CTERM sorting domain-containing protein [Luteolibacter sp. SL250]